MKQRKKEIEREGGDRESVLSERFCVHWESYRAWADTVIEGGGGYAKKISDTDWTV